MSDPTRGDSGESSAGPPAEGRGRASAIEGTSRRTFLKGAGVGAVATAVSTGVVGTAGGAGIPTPWLHRDGNLIRDPSDNRVVLRGVNIPDAKRNDTKDFRPDTSEFLEWITDETRDWYARIVRLPVQPLDIGGHDPGGIPPMPGFSQAQLDDYVENYLDPAVEKCAELGIYCIVDYHRHREQGDEYRYTSEETDAELTTFWETVAPRYADYSNVLYEVYNEPIHPYPGHNDPTVDVGVTDPESEETWNTWKSACQPWVDLIREHAPQNLILIGSPRWSQWTYWAPENEFDGDNLAYTGHVYGHPNLRPLSEYFGTPAEEVPVFMTEFGWAEDGANYLTGTPDVEGQQFLDFYEEYDHVHWQVWCFDAKWSPAMLDHDWTVKDYGVFWQDELIDKRDDDLPEGDGGSTPGGTPTPDTPTPEPDTPTPTPGDGCPEGEDAPAQVEGVYPQDLDGDGLHRDVNANCRLDSDDVVTYFDNMEDPAITDNEAMYDYNENGRIDFDDLVTLFESL